MNVIIEKDLTIPLRDGVETKADIYRPLSDDPVPVLLQRLPYDKEVRALRDQAIDSIRAALGGYAVVNQDCRGTFASDGKFYPFVAEGDDGLDSIAWAAAQPWSSGDVGAVGFSYYGATQWLAAQKDPPALRAIAPMMTSPDLYGGWAYRGGAFQLGFVLYWCLQVLGVNELLHRLNGGDATPDQVLAQLQRAESHDEFYRRLPLDRVPELRDLTPYYFDWLAHPSRDSFWTENAPEPDYGAVTVPSLHIGGWFDIFLPDTLRGYQCMKTDGGSDAAQRPQLIVGPWAHAQTLGSFPGRDFGVLASGDGIDLTALQLEWFDHQLKRGKGGWDATSPVKIFVMGPDVWRDEPDWPLPDTEFRKFFLHSDGAANTSCGDGALSVEAPAGAEPEDTFLYDPRNPVPTVGGQTFLPAVLIGGNSGPHDQREVERRHDVLCFSSEPLRADLEVTGPVTLTIYVSSSAVDTDFTAKLVNVHPGGRAELVTDGILRARYRNSPDDPELLEPNKVYRLHIDMSATATVFAADHRVRLEVSSSNFPRFDRNTNTGGPIAEEERQQMKAAINCVRHDDTYPSHLILPIIERFMTDGVGLAS